MAVSYQFNPFTGNFDQISTIALAAVGSTPNSSGASLSSDQILTLQPADGSNPGLLTAAAQTIGGSKTFSSTIIASNGIDSAAGLTVGNSTATSVTIGRPGITVNIQGSTLYENVTQLQVTDPLITINKGGGTASGGNSGIEIEENASITGYAQTSADRNSWILKAPNTAGIATITPGASGIVISQSSHDPVTLTAVGSTPNANAASLSSQALTLQPADGSNPGVITAGTQTIGGAKTFSSALTASSLTVLGTTNLAAALQGPLRASTGTVSAGPINLTTEVTGILPVANGGTGAATLASNSVLLGNGTSAVQTVAPGTAGNILSSNGTTWTSIPSSSSSAKNYLGNVNGINGNGNFELGATTKWSLFNTTLTGLIPTGSVTAGAASITTFSVVSTGQLAGSYSLRTAASSAWSAGQGFITDAFTIDLEDQARVMQIYNYFKVVTGASNMNFSGTSSNTFAMYLYDVTNSAWIQPAGVYSFTQNSGIGKSNGTAQTTSTSTQYRLAIICINTTAGAVDLYWDDFFFGPEVAPLGAAITDWKSYTPTFTALGTVTNINFVYRQVGDSIEVYGRWTNAASGQTASQARISLPSGLSTADTTKIPSTMAAGPSGQSVAQAVQVVPLITASQTYMTLGLQSGTAASLTSANGNMVAGSAFDIAIYAVIPILGWSSNVVSSSSTSTRVLSVRASKTSTQSIPTGTNTTITGWTSVDFDDSAMFNSTTGEVTIAVSGTYSVSANVSFAGNATGIRSFYVVKGTTNQFVSGVAAGSASGNIVNGSGLVKCNAGDIIKILAFQSSGGALNVGDGIAEDTTLSVFRLSGPSVIAATDTIAGRYTSTAGQSFTNGNTVIVQFPTIDFDTTGSFNTTTNQIVVPVSGKYEIKASIWFGSSSAGTRALYVYKNGSLHSVIYSQDGVTVATTLSGSALVNAIAGDLIDIRAIQASGATLSVSNSQGYVWMSFQRTGN